MTRLMVGGDFLFFIGNNHGAPLSSHHDLVLGLLEVSTGHFILVGTCRKQSSLVNQIFQVSTGKPRRSLGDYLKFDITTQRHFAGMDLEDFQAATNVGPRHDHLAIETAWTKQSGVKHVGPVRRGNQENALIGLKTVHFNQQLVEGLLALVMATTHTGATMTTDGIYFVDKDNARSILLALDEQVPDTAGTDTDKHLNKVGTRNRKEGHSRLAGNRPAEKSFTRTRGAYQQHAFRDPPTKPGKLFRVFQKRDNLFQFVLGFIDPGNIIEGDLGLGFAEQFGAALAEAHGFATARLHLAHEEDPYGDQQQDRTPGNQNGHPETVAFVRLGLNSDALPAQQADQVRVIRNIGLECRTICVGAFKVRTLDRHVDHLTLIEGRQEGRIWDRLEFATLLGHHIEKHDHHQRDDQPE